jgi:carboxymethylenebutenolidase
MMHERGGFPETFSRIIAKEQKSSLDCKEREMDQRIIALYDEYTHAPLERRDFLNRLAQLVGGIAAAETLLPLLENRYAQAALIAPDDARLDTSFITYPGVTGAIRAYRAKPKDGAKLPGVVVIHENRGLNPHIEDVARRTAIAGFFALAPDALSPQGGTPSDEDKARSMISQLDRQTTIQNLVAAVSFLQSHPESTGKVGCVGFCWGGGMANQLAVHAPALLAAVAFYGPQPAPEEVRKIKASLLLHYAGLDERINAGIPAFEEALKATSVDYTIHMYQEVNHAFHNDTASARYNKEAAQLAWQRTITFLTEKLKS